MTVGESDDTHLLSPAEWPSDFNEVARADLTMGFGGLPIHVNLPSPTCTLRLGSRLEQTSNVEPDVEADGAGRCFHGVVGEGLPPTRAASTSIVAYSSGNVRPLH